MENKSNNVFHNYIQNVLTRQRRPRNRAMSQTSSTPPTGSSSASSQGMTNAQRDALVDAYKRLSVGTWIAVGILGLMFIVVIISVLSGYATSNAASRAQPSQLSSPPFVVSYSSLSSSSDHTLSSAAPTLTPIPTGNPTALLLVSESPLSGSERYP